jgi:hypothetical protein
MNRDADLLVDIELPDDIQAGTDEGGLPIAVPVTKPVTEAKPAAPVPTIAELEQARRERDAARQTATRFETESKTNAEALRLAQEAAEAERGKRTQAEQLAHQRTLDSAALAYHRVNAELQGVTTNISSLKNYVAQAESNLQAAHEANDPTRIARATAEISRATADLSAMEQAEGQWRAELDRAKRGYEQVVAQTPKAVESVKKEERVAPPAKETVQEDRTPKPEQDPEAWINQWPRKTTGAWLREHRDYVTDAAKHQELITFANDYAADYGGHMLHSASFIEELNRKFFPASAQEAEQVTETQDAEGGEEVDTTPSPTPTRTTVSAPVSRSSITGKASGNNAKVRLSPAEAQAAEDLFGPGSAHNLSPAEARKAYAVNKLRAERDGKYSLNPNASQ